MNAGKEKKGKRGFFFTLTVVVLLSFMLASAGMWTRVIEARESAQPQKLKIYSFAQVLDEVTDAKLAEFTQISAYYAFFKLSNHTFTEHTRLAWDDANADPDNKGTANVNRSIYDLMLNGNTTGGSTNWAGSNALQYGTNEMKYTLSYWNGTMARTTGLMGFNFTMGNITGFEAKQDGPWNATVKFNTTVTIVDSEGTFYMTRNLTANTTVWFDGFADPMIAYLTYMHQRMAGLTAVAPARQIFRNTNWQTIDAVAPKKIKDGPYGKGWFYGRLTPDNPSLSDINNGVYNTTYILVISEPVADASHDYTAYLNSFGAVIIKNAPFDNLSADTVIDAGVSAPGQCAGTKRGTTDVCTKTTSSSCKFYIHRQTKCVDCLEWTSKTCDNESKYTDTDPDCICTDTSLVAIQPQEILNAYLPSHQMYDINPHVWNNSINVPFIAGTGDPTAAGSPLSRLAAAGGGQYVLIDNEKNNDTDDDAAGISRGTGNSLSYHRIWDIEKLRDMAISGLYVEAPNKAPSYFQRLTGGALTAEPLLASGYGKYGIETFVLGRWAGGIDDDPDFADYSRADMEFYRELGDSDTALNIKGMPGCINKQRCASEYNLNADLHSPFGYFKLYKNINTLTGSAYDFGAENMTCPRPLSADIGATCK